MAGLHPHLVPVLHVQEDGSGAGRGVGTAVVAAGTTQDVTVDEHIDEVGSEVRSEELEVEVVDTGRRGGVDASVGVVAAAESEVQVEEDGSVGRHRFRQHRSERYPCG